MKTLTFDSSAELRAKTIQSMIDTPMTGEALSYIMEMGKKELLQGNDLVKNRFPFTGTDLLDEDGNSYPRVEFEILSLHDAADGRWISGIEFRLNLTEFFDHADELLTEALERKVTQPTDVTLEQLLASL